MLLLGLLPMVRIPRKILLNKMEMSTLVNKPAVERKTRKHTGKREEGNRQTEELEELLFS